MYNSKFLVDNSKFFRQLYQQNIKCKSKNQVKCRDSFDELEKWLAINLKYDVQQVWFRWMSSRVTGPRPKFSGKGGVRVAGEERLLFMYPSPHRGGHAHIAHTTLSVLASHLSLSHSTGNRAGNVYHISVQPCSVSVIVLVYTCVFLNLVLYFVKSHDRTVFVSIGIQIPFVQSFLPPRQNFNKDEWEAFFS